jgi:hypothetical protein
MPFLYTSHFRAGKLILAGDYAPVRISVGNPRFKLPYELVGACKLLMPTRDMLKLPIDEYRDRFIGILEGHGVSKIREEIERLANEAVDRDLVFLCFEKLEKPGEWCHRRMFAEWWVEKTGESIPELHSSY